MTEDMWGTGDYRAVAEKVTSIGTSWCRGGDRARHGGMDVACGTGNAAIPEANRGARVTGLDFRRASSQSRANVVPKPESTSSDGR